MFVVSPLEPITENDLSQIFNQDLCSSLLSYVPYMIPANNYLWYRCPCVFLPLLCVMAGVHQAHQHILKGYYKKGEEATSCFPLPIISFGNKLRDKCIKMPLLICHYFASSSGLARGFGYVVFFLTQFGYKKYLYFPGF